MPEIKCYCSRRADFRDGGHVWMPGESCPPRSLRPAHYDPDSRRWMVQIDQFVARPATEREEYEAVKAYLIEAVSHGRERLGDDVVEDVIGATFDA